MAVSLLLESSPRLLPLALKADGEKGLGKETGVYELKTDSGRADDEKGWNPSSHSKSNRQELLITGRWKLG